MYCSHCGKPYAAGDAFCENCGLKIEAQGYAPQPHAYVPPMQGSSRMLVVLLIEASDSAAAYYQKMVAHLSKFVLDVSGDSMAQNAVDMAIVQFNESMSVLPELPDITNTGYVPYIRGSSSFHPPIMEAVRMAKEHSTSFPGAFKPWVIMLSSGHPADDISHASYEIQNMQGADMLRFMALSVDGLNAAFLKRLTDVVFTQQGHDFGAFFGWLGECVKTIVRTPPGMKPQLPQLTGNVYRVR